MHSKDLQGIRLSLTNRATHLCKRNGVVNVLKHTAPHMYYHAEFGPSALKGVGKNTGKPQKLESAIELRLLGMGDVADHKIHDLPHMCCH